MERMQQICDGLGATFNTKVELDYRKGYPATINTCEASVRKVWMVPGRDLKRFFFDLLVGISIRRQGHPCALPHHVPPDPGALTLSHFFSRPMPP